MRALFVCLTLLVSLALSSAADAQPRTAREHLQVATAHFQNGRFQDAATEFQAAFDISHNDSLLYNIARSLGNAGNVEAAIEAYQRFREAGCPGVNRQEVEDALRALESRRTRLPVSVQNQPPVANPTQSGTSPTQPPVITPPLTHQATGPIAQPPITVRPAPTMSTANRVGPWITMGLGAALSVVAVQQGVSAAGSRSVAADAAAGNRPYTLEVQQAVDSVEGESARAIAFGIAGGAAIAGGALWLALRGNSNTNERPPTVQPVIGLNQLGIAGTF